MRRIRSQSHNTRNARRNALLTSDALINHELYEPNVMRMVTEQTSELRFVDYIVRPLLQVIDILSLMHPKVKWVIALQDENENDSKIADEGEKINSRLEALLLDLDDNRNFKWYSFSHFIEVDNTEFTHLNDITLKLHLYIYDKDGQNYELMSAKTNGLIHHFSQDNLNVLYISM
jgi:hypothetical protein